MIYVAHGMQQDIMQNLQQGAHPEEVVFGPLRQQGTAAEQAANSASTLAPQRTQNWSSKLTEAEIIVAGGSAITEELIQRCPKVRWFHSVSAGVDLIPHNLLSARGILLSNSRGIHGRPIGEQVLGMMIGFTRGLHVNLRHQQQKRWEPGYPLQELTGQTLCIVGSGSIGAEVARKAKAFDMRVIGVKRHPLPLPHHDEVVGLDSLYDALATADFVLVLTPLTPNTRHLLDAEAFATMKSSAVVLNFARGDVMDEEALIQALQAGKLRGAGLDVFHREPLPPESPLWDMENVLISPHNGGWTPHYNERMVAIFLNNLRAYREQRPLPTGVDLIQGY
ncbi:D-2-hydroxyacid dehydrogenase [Alicyclobacillaceae bacterium I2511]|nr:D-2-hydroxyacid dehydrogenase [Alicyclobacillaceae bacterium I2511]